MHSGPAPEGLEYGHAAKRLQAPEAAQGTDSRDLLAQINIREVPQGYHTEVEGIPHAAEVPCEEPKCDNAKYCLHREADGRYLICT